MDAPLLGAHVSTAGGAARAVPRAEELGCEAIQIFVKSPQQWRGPDLSEAAAAAFRDARRASQVRAVVAHAAYLINLASPDDAVRDRSCRGLADELERCHRLGVGALILHPGSHLGAGVEAGVARAAESLRRVLGATRGLEPRLLLEGMAGQGTTLGRWLEELAELRAAAGDEARVGLCLDTCHAFAAGYAVDEEAGWSALLDEVEGLFGLPALGCVHLNDSRHSRGSRRDRHANLGEGEIGEEAFARIVREPRLAGLPLIVETPRGRKAAGHRADLALLRRLARIS